MPLYGAAKNLQDTTGIVNVSSSAAPAVGQILTATSSVAATWQTPAGATITSTCGIFAGPSNTSGAQTNTITHGLGRTPNIIRIQSIGPKIGNASSTAFSISYGIKDASGNAVIYLPGNVGQAVTSNPVSSSTIGVYIDGGTSSSASATAVIQNLTSTTFDVVWTTSNGPLNTIGPVLLWEAM